MSQAGQVNADRISARIERVPFGPFHARLVALLGAGLLFDAFDVYVISVVAVTVTAFKLNDATIGFIISRSVDDDSA